MSVSWDEEILYVEIPVQGVPTVDVLSTPISVDISPTGLQGASGPMGPAPPITFGRRATCEVATGKLKYVMGFTATLTGYWAALGVGTPPVGDDLVAQIKINGVTQATVTIPDGSEYLPFTPMNEQVVMGDYLTVDIVQVGSTEPGDDLSIFIMYEI